MPAEKEKLVIAVFVAVVLVVVVLVGINMYQEAQPKPQPTPRPTPLTPIPTFAGYPVYRSPDTRAEILCYLQVMDNWRPLEYVATGGRVWVRIIADNEKCWGWIPDPG